MCPRPCESLQEGTISHLIGCFSRVLDPALLHDLLEPKVAISRSSLNVRTLMGNLRALAETAIAQFIVKVKATGMCNKQ